MNVCTKPISPFFEDKEKNFFEGMKRVERTLKFLLEMKSIVVEEI